MLTKIRIRNYQCWEKLDLDLVGSITTFEGSSGIGKSAICRAVRWNAENKPTGDSFIREGANKTTVQLIFDDTKVTRIRSNTTNTYKLTGHKKPFAGFGTTVPEPVQRALGINNSNFQRQHDLPYWFSKTAGEVSKELNRIVNLELIDEALANVASKMRKGKIAIEISNEQLESTTEQVKSLSYVEDKNKDLTGLERQSENLTAGQQSVNLLRNLTVIAISQRKWLSMAAIALNFGITAQQIGESMQIAKKRCQLLGELVLDAEKYQKIKPPPDISPVEEAMLEYKSKLDGIDRLNKLILEVIICQNQIKEAEQKMEDGLKIIKQKFKAICPVCNQSLKS